jgi:hypothetical protein
VSSFSISEPLIERWNGADWTIQSTPSSGAMGPRLAAVSCPSEAVCTAVGQRTDNSAALAERYS